MQHSPFTIHIVYEDAPILRINFEGEIKNYYLTFDQLTLLIEQAAPLLRTTAGKVYRG